MFTTQRAFAGASALFLSMVLGSTTLPASAATAPTVVTGKITKVTSSTLQVKTSTGVVTGKMTTIAVVTKSVRVSLAKVVKGAFVSLTLATGGKTVTRISIGGARGLGGARRPGGTPRTGRPRGTPPGGFASGRFHGGQVISIGRSQIALKSIQGKSTTYALSKTVSVTKSERGSRTDLHVGETVRIVPIGTGNTTFSLTIVSG